MKICFATYDNSSDVGGVSSWMRRLLPFLQDSGMTIEVHLMAFGGKPGVNCEFYKKKGIPVRWLPLQLHLPQAVRSFLRLLEKSQPDVYVPNCIVPAYYAGGYAKRAGIPTVGVLHSDDPFYWGIVEEFLFGASEFRLSAVVPVSRFLEAQIESTAAALNVTVRRIGCGVPIPTNAAALPKSIFRLIYTGRLVEEQKRISDVTKALCDVAQHLPNIEAWIVGEGEAKPAVQNIIRERGIGSRVRLLGRVDNSKIYDLLAQCHSLVLLSDYEGLPVSVLEAMAAGVVPICLDTRSGIREAIHHEMNGLLVSDREAGFYNAVKNINNDLGKWQEMSAAARMTVRDHYSIEACGREWIRLLDNLRNERGRANNFRAPRVLRLPPPNAKFGKFGTNLLWSARMRNYILATAPLYRLAKAVLVAGRRASQKRSGLETAPADLEV